MHEIRGRVCYTANGSLVAKSAFLTDLMMEVRLVLLEGGKSAEVRPQLPTVIGRNTEADVQVPDSMVSRRHCELYDYEGQLAVRDLGSANGTLVNQHRIEQDTLLSTGDTLSIGKVTFRVEVDGPSAESYPPSEEPVSADTPSALDQAPAAASQDESAARKESEVLKYDASESGISEAEETVESDQQEEPPSAGEAETHDEDEDEDGLDDFLKSLGD